MRATRELEWAAREEGTPIGAPLRVVAVGGGTGLPRVLCGLASSREAAGGVGRLDVTAIVATSDDGGSSGELRRCYGIPAPGDVRNCLVALSGAPFSDLFQHRFQGDGGLAGHTVGNVVLAALAQRLGGFRAAVETAGDLLATRGRVLPATDELVDLVATMDDGRVVRGERAMAAAGGRVKEVSLDRPIPAVPAALAAMAAADLLVLGPGSLYSSVIAPLLAGGMADALRSCKGTRVLVVNLFTEPGETDGHTAADHVRAVQRHVGRVVDVALLHDAPPWRPARPAGSGSPVVADTGAVADLGAIPFATDLVDAQEPRRHDPSRLARVLLGFARTT
jgi:uncharacterized cofD-like protein